MKTIIFTIILTVFALANFAQIHKYDYNIFYTDNHSILYPQPNLSATYSFDYFGIVNPDTTGYVTVTGGSIPFIGGMGGLKASTCSPGTYAIYTISGTATQIYASTGGTNYSEFLTIRQATISYSNITLCQNDSAHHPILSVNTTPLDGGMTATQTRFFSGAGLSIDSITGVITPSTSTLGAYTVSRQLRYKPSGWLYFTPVDTITCTVAIINCSSVNITEQTTNNSLEIYPNPFNSLTTIAFAEEQMNSTIKLTDIVGKEIKTINFTGKQLTIERGEMKEGIYFVQITDQQKNIINKKLIIK